MDGKLRIGLLLDGVEVRAWQYVMLERIVLSHYAELVVVVLPDSVKTEGACLDEPQLPADTLWQRIAAWPLLTTYRLLEAKIAVEPDACAAKDARALLQEIPKIPLNVRNGDVDAATEAIDQLSTYKLDVLLELRARERLAELAAACKYGVWWLQHDGGTSKDRVPDGFWAVRAGRPVMETILWACNSGGRPPTALARSWSGTNPFSVKLNRSLLYWKTLSLVPRKLEALHRFGADALVDRTRQERPDYAAGGEAVGCSPTHAHLAGHISRNIAHRARCRWDRTFGLEQWTLIFHYGNKRSISPSEFRKITPPKDRYWADPHAIERDNRYYVFFEDCAFATEKGRIAVLELRKDGTYDGPATVLERPYHLSYPFVFQVGDELYMVPETAENRTVELYRCVEFPGKWQLVENLLENISAFDATLIYHNDKWWLFANLLENNGASPSEELFLFYSERLLGGAWKPHPANPIVSDVSRSRPAGAIFRENGRLYRPAQDCSIRYGYGVTVHEITTLSEACYEEVETERIKPAWDKSVLATHTLAYIPGVTVMDALVRRMRFG